MKYKTFCLVKWFSLTCFFAIVLSQNVFADGAVVPSDGWVSPGSGCINYCTTNIGWVYHKWGEDLDLSDVDEMENGDHLIHGYGYPESTYKPGNTYVPAKCASTGGYYRLAFYAIKDFTGDPQHGSIEYSKMQQIGVLNFKMLKGIDSSFSVDENTGAISGVNMYGWEEAYENFKKLKAYDAQYGTDYASGYEWSIDSNFGVFCFSEDMLSMPEYYGSSHVALTPKPQGASKNWASTGITGEYKEKNFGPLVIVKGEKVDITFSHNIYAKQSVNDVDWKVERSWIYGSGGYESNGYEFGTQANGILSAVSSGKVNLDTLRDGYYVQSVGNYTDGTYQYVMRDVYSQVEFNVPGEYKFCESLTINEFAVKDKPITKACVTIKVNEGPTYSAESNIAVKHPHVETTGRVESFTAITDKMAYLRVNEPSPVTFSHRIYASRPVAGVNWAVKRIFAICGEGDNSANCVMAARENTDINNGNSGFSPLVEFSNTPVTMEGDDGADYYQSPLSDRPYMDGDESHHFNWRDIYWLKISKVGDYSNNKLCEMVSIPGSDKNLTSVCALVKVPYNFKNSASVELSERDEVVAGGIVRIGVANVVVGSKNNEVVGSGEYATQVDDATVKLISYYYDPLSSQIPGNNEIAGYGSYGSNLCDAISNKNGCKDDVYREEHLNFNSGNDASGAEAKIFGAMNSTYTANAPVGSYFCVALAVYPYASGKLLNANTGTYVDTNTTPAEVNADNSWYISKPSCARVVKRPTFQVLGGSVYSAGVVKSLTTEKIVSSERKAFGSWAEQSVVANGAVVKFASGAALSKGSDPDFCRYQVPLTFANSGCSSNQAGSADIAANTSGRDAITNYWWLDNPVKNTTSWEEGTSNGGSKLKYKYSDGDITFNGMSNISGDATYVIRSENGNIYINGNIEYANGPYNMASQIPKMLIYANNIYIKCDVQRVDAILMAKSMINTCAKNDSSLYNNSDKNDVNNPNRATTQLTVNGILMAEQILFDRTYGGDGHIEGEGGVNTPAEIVNYDTSAVIWGREEVTDDIDDSFKIIYQQELAPRY